MQSMAILSRGEGTGRLRFLRCGAKFWREGATQEEKFTDLRAIESFVNTKTCTQDEILYRWAKNAWSAVS